MFSKTIKKKSENQDYDKEKYDDLGRSIENLNEVDDQSIQDNENETPETLDSVPDFVVAFSEDKLRKQHATFENIDMVRIRTDSDKIIVLRENYCFSYSSARNSYLETYSLEKSETDSQLTEVEYNWQNFAVGAKNYKWQKLSNIGPHKETRCSLVCKENKNQPLQWIFFPIRPVQVEQLLLFVNSDDSVNWTVEVWMPDITKPITIELTPGLEKIDKLGKLVKKMILTAKVPEKAKLFEENYLKNQVSLVVAVNQQAETYLKLTQDGGLPRPSEQNDTNAITITPDGNDVFTFNYSRLRPPETNRRGEPSNRETKGDSNQVNGVHGGGAKAFIENWKAFRFVDDGKVSDSKITGRLRYSRPTDASQVKEHESISWRFINAYDLPITEVFIYVNSMAEYDVSSGDQNENPPDLEWKLQTNSYECALKDKQSNVVKLQSSKEENFHNEIVLKLEMNPKKIQKFFVTTESAPQIRMKLKFDTKSENLKAVRRVKWSPNLKIQAPEEEKPTDLFGKIKSKIEGAYSNLKSSFTHKTQEPSCCLIIAIDETKMFSQSGNGSIQPKLRRAVNDLVLKLLNRIKKVRHHDENEQRDWPDQPYRDDVGIVVVRFGGTDYEYNYDPENFNEDNMGPFRKQKVLKFEKKGTSIYEFVPKPNAKFTDEDAEAMEGDMGEPRASVDMNEVPVGSDPDDFDPKDFDFTPVNPNDSNVEGDYNYEDYAGSNAWLDFFQTCEMYQDGNLKNFDLFVSRKNPLN